MFLYRKIYILLYTPLCNMTDKKETISLKIDPQLWIKAKQHCIGKRLKYSDYVESLIRKDLEKK